MKFIKVNNIIVNLANIASAELDSDGILHLVFNVGTPNGALTRQFGGDAAQQIWSALNRLVG